ncbi:MAG: SDR family NAD(P)-dependent oxidoreductase [Burkholderiaceae bacterium]|nr:SDR family NAD(P)-dependent oxidoreductase [Burkholderiaceae bacterium]
MNPRIRDWRGKRVWIIGASSGIGAATAQLLLNKGARVALSARRRGALETLCRGRADALPLALDMLDHTAVMQACTALRERWSGIDLVLIAAGGYAEMRADSFDLAAAKKLVDVNLHGVLHCLDAVLPLLLAQRAGAIGIVSSVAGYNGLPRALIYGPTKAALINLCETLYLDLRPKGIGVHMINPGFVDTPMTADNPFPMPALITPAEAAHHIVHDLERGAFHIHFPHRFTNWLRLARLLPYGLYFPLVRKVTGL